MSHAAVPSKPDSSLHVRSVDEAREIVRAQMTVLQTQSVPLDAALGRVLAAPVLALRDQPPFHASAMDGYAVRAADTPGDLAVIGEAAAGRGFAGRCDKGMAVRISTGAAMPDGADAIVIQEDARRDGDRITVPRAAPKSWVRPRGGDFKAGAALLAAGRRLDGVALALAAASGAASLPVAAMPRIAILCSGDELAAPGTTPGPHQIFDSATHGVAALVRSWGGVARQLDVTRDDPAAIARAAEHGLNNSDLLLVIGGASVGDHDHAKPALLRLGLQLAFQKVAVRPGRPTWFGATPLGPVLGLPGNPASALVCAHLFLRPALAAMQGCAPAPRLHCARLTQALPANGPREHYLRARACIDDTGQWIVHAFEDQDSSLLSVFAGANALIRLMPDAAALPKDALVDVLMLDFIMLDRP